MFFAMHIMHIFYPFDKIFCSVCRSKRTKGATFLITKERNDILPENNPGNNTDPADSDK